MQHEICIEELYASRKELSDKAYAQITVASMICCAVGIAIAVAHSILLGGALCVISAAVYKYFSSEDIYKQLGIKFESDCGSARITKVVPVLGDTAVIPRRVAWYDVGIIGVGAIKCDSEASPKRLYLPLSITKIDGPPFSAHALPSADLPKIYFEGTREHWESIDGSALFSDCSVVFECPQPSSTRERRARRTRL